MCKGVFDWDLLELVLTGQGFVSPVLYNFYIPVLQWFFFLIVQLCGFEGAACKPFFAGLAFVKIRVTFCSAHI
jgi:hypothetical protein